MKFNLSIGGLIAALLLSSSALATPLDTLDFGFVKFVKGHEGLYRRPVRQVCIKYDRAEAHPSAIVFTNEIVFIGRDGRETTRDALPDTGVKITESAHGEYIYIFGPFQNRAGGFHRLYTFDGKILLQKDTNTPVGASGMGAPLEGPREFLMGEFGKVALAKFDGQIVAERQLLNKELQEDGDIFVAADPEGGRIFAAANKFKLPVGQASFNRPILYALDSRLNEIFADTLQSLLVVSLNMSQNGKFLLLNEETDNANTLNVLNLAGHKLISFENPKRTVFAANSDYLIYLPHNASPEILSSTDWGEVYHPALSSPSSWIDAGISDDGSFAALYSGDEIVLLDIIHKAYSRINFPYAFRTCRFYGNELILTGEFGYEIYGVTR